MSSQVFMFISLDQQIISTNNILKILLMNPLSWCACFSISLAMIDFISHHGRSGHMSIAEGVAGGHFLCPLWCETIPYLRGNFLKCPKKTMDKYSIWKQMDTTLPFPMYIQPIPLAETCKCLDQSKIIFISPNSICDMSSIFLLYGIKTQTNPDKKNR